MFAIARLCAPAALSPSSSNLKTSGPLFPDPDVATVTLTLTLTTVAGETTGLEGTQGTAPAGAYEVLKLAVGMQ